jgi:glycosyltransferase involved in cell wall biosynthesis
MRLLFIADGRSPTTLAWLIYWIKAGNEVHLISTFNCDPPPGLKTFHVIPVAFGSIVGKHKRSTQNGYAQFRSLIKRFRNLLLPVRYFLGPLLLSHYQRLFLEIVNSIQPDLVHALRIPFEGMLTSKLPPQIPLVVSIWGNDLTLHAHGSILMAAHTRQVLKRSDGLIADAYRDIRLGTEYGFAANKPTLVVPGSGGIRIDEINSDSRNRISLPEELPKVPIVINPRGQRPGSLRQDVFFQAIPMVLKIIPRVLFICPQLAGDIESEHWVNQLCIQDNVKLWPALDRKQMWVLLKKAQIYVSPSIHDGTPNSFLEAMACGCFPIVGNIESMQEWINSGENGLLVDATSPRSLADGIISALNHPSQRNNARNINIAIIAKRANYQQCMEQTGIFYQKVIDNLIAYR